MAIFRCRPLALGCILLIVTAALLFILPFSASLILSLVTVALLLLLGALFGWRGKRYYLLLALVAALFIALGSSRALLERRYVNKCFSSQIDNQVSATFEVEEIYKRSSYGSMLRVELSELNGVSCHVKALLLTEDFSPFSLCDTVSGSFICKDLRQNVLYEDQVTQFVSDGAYVALTPAPSGDMRLAESGNDHFLSRLFDFRELLHFRVTSLFPGEGGELLSALLLGTRDTLQASTVRDFRRIGISHLLALSGLHLTILLGISEKFLSWLHVGKRWRLLFFMCFSFSYLLLTGFTYSMLRAVLMLTLLQISFLVKEDYDAFTALCVGGAGMVLATPYAIFDLSFQMTMLATFGILSFGKLQAKLTRWIPRSTGWRGLISYTLRAILSSLLITLSATAAILPIQWLTFGEISLLSPLSNLLMIPLATVALVLGLLLLLLLPVSAIAAVIAFPAGAITSVMVKLAALFSPADCMLSLRYDFVPYILIPFFLITALLLVIDLKKLDFLVLSPMALTIAAFSVCLCVSSYMGKNELTVIYRDTGSNEGVLLIQNDTAMICDISNGSYTQLYEDYRLLRQCCATEIEVLMLTHYHDRQVTSLSRFGSSILIRSVWLPIPTNSKDREILAELLEVADRQRIAVTIYSHDTPLTVFETGTVTLSEPIFEKRSVEPALSATVCFGEKALIYQSGARSEYERHTEKIDAKTGNYFILGSHGPVPHEEILPQIANVPEEIVIGSERVLLKYDASHDTRYVLYPKVKAYVLE